MLKLHITHKVIHLTAALLSVTLLGVLMDKPGIGYAVFALLILVIVFYASDRRLDERIKKLAHTLVNYSMRVKQGENVYVHYTGASTEELARQVV